MLIPTMEAIGGAERQVLLLATELAKSGHAVTVVALSGGGGAMHQKLKEAGVGYHSLEMRKAWIDPLGWWRYFAWTRRERPEIVHAHLPHASWFGRWMRLIWPVRVLIDTIHTSATGGRWRRIGYRLSDWLTDHVTCVSAAVADMIAASGIASREHMTILPNGVAIPEIPANAARSGRGFDWISVGRLSRVKDYPTLLRAFARLPVGARLTIAGSGPDEAALQVLAASLGVGGRVDLVGFQAEIQPWLARADGFVLSSLWEGLPISVLEAQAAGLPVVATDGCGTREAMEVGRSGLLAPVGDSDALAVAMARVMALSPEGRTSMGLAGREFVRRNFALTSIVDRWLALYGRLLIENPVAKRRSRRRAQVLRD
jgi:glycosyltransferase involved in cell wall biosynthesis